MGKTTIAAAVVQSDEIRSSFEKIVWVSVGQEPDIRQLQDSMHHQLSEQHFSESVKTDDDAFTAVRNAAKGSKVLLVLDDVWDPKHEKPLNCIDLDNSSKLLVTTRVRGLLKNAAEVGMGVLSQPKALKLLLSSAEMNEGDLEDGTDEHRSAIEIVELCGRLPLTLAIAGGMVADTGQGFNDDIVETMKEAQELEDEEGMTVETRVILTSEKMMTKSAGKHKDLVGEVFRFFACFPEDVPVPAAVFNKMAPVLSDENSDKKARLAVGACLGTLLKYNLLKGSLSSGSGVFMHDIVRDHVISRHSRDELRALQKTFVVTFLAARPEPGGFVMPSFAGPETFEGYGARSLHWHLRGALEDGEDPPDAWLAHPDEIVKVNTATAVGLGALVALSEAREGAEELVGAAQASWVASLTKGLPQSTFNDLVHRAADLLERADDKEALEFELDVCGAAGRSGMGSERGQKVAQRLKVLAASKMTFESRFGEIFAILIESWTKLGIYNKGEGLENGARDDAIEQALSKMNEFGRLGGAQEVVELANHPSEGNWCENCFHAMAMGVIIVASPLEQWNPDAFGNSEAGLVKGIDFYRPDICGRAFKEWVVVKADLFLYGWANNVVALYCA